MAAHAVLEVVQLDDFAASRANKVDECVATVANEAAEECHSEDIDSATGTLLSGVSIVHLIDILVFLEGFHGVPHLH